MRGVEALRGEVKRDGSQACQVHAVGYPGLMSDTQTRTCKRDATPGHSSVYCYFKQLARALVTRQPLRGAVIRQT